MARPTIDDDVLDRLEEAVDARTKVPATHLTTEEQLSFALDTVDGLADRVGRLTERVSDLEDELESVRADEPDDSPSAGEIADADLGGGFTNNFGPNNRRR